jgi:hypothetical protein
VCMCVCVYGEGGGGLPPSFSSPFLQPASMVLGLLPHTVGMRVAYENPALLGAFGEKALRDSGLLREPVAVSKDESAIDVLRVMLRHRVTAVAVTGDEGEFLGCVDAQGGRQDMTHDTTRLDLTSVQRDTTRHDSTQDKTTLDIIRQDTTPHHTTPHHTTPHHTTPHGRTR